MNPSTWRLTNIKRVAPKSFHNSVINVETTKRLLERVAKEHKITDMSDWYKLSTKDVNELGGKFREISLVRILSTVYPEHEWLPWKFAKVPLKFWDDIKNQRSFIEWASKELKIKDMNEWYNRSPQDIFKLGGKTLIEKHSNIHNLLAATIPEFNWVPWKFKQIPRFSMNDLTYQRKLLDSLKKDLNINQMSDWYNVSLKDFIAVGGGGIGLNVRYGNSLSRALAAIYPEYDWLPWKFSQRHWVTSENVKKFVIWVAKEMGIKDMEEWYNVGNSDFVKFGGERLVHNMSIAQALAITYPEYPWKPWKFPKFDANEKNENCRMFMESVAKQLNIKDLNDWYNITTEKLRSFDGGDRILMAYNRSLLHILTAAYPEHGWLSHKFPTNKKFIPHNWKLFLDSVSNKLNIKELKDWYKITAEQIIDLGGGSLLVKNNTLPTLLSQVFPEFSWDVSQFTQISDIWTDEKCAKYFVEWLQKSPISEISHVHKIIQQSPQKGILLVLLKNAFPQFFMDHTKTRKSQYMLKSYLEKIFKVVVVEEFRHPDLNQLELDYFIPEFNLAFEYQGEQHFKRNEVFFKMQSKNELGQRDKQKAEITKEKGITLIEIPYWWDKKQSSLESTIYNVRPDLFPYTPLGTPIPSSPPSPSPSRRSTTKTSLMTTTEWDTQQNPTGWYMTEKYDGMRLFWNGKDFYSRNGEHVKVVKEITNQMPKVALDGELWTQYGLYQEAVNLAKSTNEEKWSKATFWVFDVPDLKEKAIEERIEFMKELKLPTFAKVVNFVKCEGNDHLIQFNQDILAKGGEGVMLREPNSFYTAGRSSSLRRYKPFLDTEVQVIENQYPHGLSCKQMNGKIVFVKFVAENMEEVKNLKTGSVITVKHGGMNVYGTLQYPQFFRERSDMSWSDLNKAIM